MTAGLMAPHEEEEEDKGTTEEWVRAGLEWLPVELVEELVSHLDLSASLALTSLLPTVHQVVAQERVWAALVSRTRLDSVDLAGVSSYLATVGQPEPLLLLLLDALAARYPVDAYGDSNLMVRRGGPHTTSSPTSPCTSLCPSALGAMVELGRSGLAAACPVVEVRVQGYRVEGALLASLADWVELQQEEVQVLEVGSLQADTEEEVRWCTRLLERCTEWRVEGKLVAWEVGEEGWRGLARAMARGKVQYLTTGREEVARGRREDVRRVWEGTQGWWWVDGEVVEAWEEVEEVLAMGQEEWRARLDRHCNWETEGWRS